MESIALRRVFRVGGHDDRDGAKRRYRRYRRGRPRFVRDVAVLRDELREDLGPLVAWHTDPPDGRPSDRPPQEQLFLRPQRAVIVFADPQAPAHDALFWKDGRQQAVRQDRWKLLLDGLITLEDGKLDRLRGEDAVFLVDVQSDPGETRNLRRDHPDIVDRLQARLHDWLDDTK